MGKVIVYLQDDTHALGMYKFLKRNLELYIGSEEYQRAISDGAEHMPVETTGLLGDSEGDSHHIELIVRNNDAPHHNLLSEKGRKTGTRKRKGPDNS